MFSLTPGTPGRRQQMPRTIRSICTPACEARYSASITAGSTRRFILKIRRPSPLLALALDLALDQREQAAAQVDRGHQQLAIAWSGCE